MKFRASAIYLVMTLILINALSGCSSIYRKYGYGELAQSRRIDGKPATPVTMPSDAPSISQRFRPVGIADTIGAHNGIDLFVPVGTRVIAAADGVVRRVSFSILYGNQIFIDHAKTVEGKLLQTRYFHLDEPWVKAEESVTRGQHIGDSGLSGLAAGFPHLHFEVHERTLADGIPSSRVLDPQGYWVDGVGKITCFDAMRQWPEPYTLLTYPAPCKNVD